MTSITPPAAYSAADKHAQQRERSSALSCKAVMPPQRPNVQRDRQINRFEYNKVLLQHIARLENAAQEQGTPSDSPGSLVAREKASIADCLQECFRFEKNQSNAVGTDWPKLLLKHKMKPSTT